MTLSAVQQPYRWRFGRRCYDLGTGPLLMGILNVTPDSFYDGSRYRDPAPAIARALAMEGEGADLIDIGGESTRPGAAPVDAAEELRRVIPVIEGLAGRLRIPLSIDTTKATVAKAALAAGAEIVNDISGLTFDPALARVVAELGAGLVLMHTRGTPGEMQRDTAYADLVGEIREFLGDALERAREAGIESERIVVDPGIGFGKNAAGNLEIIRRLREFASLGRPVLLGPSRKSFIGAVLGGSAADRLFGTAAAVAVALANGATLFRVHDVKVMRDVVDMAWALVNPDFRLG